LVIKALDLNQDGYSAYNAGSESGLNESGTETPVEFLVFSYPCYFMFRKESVELWKSRNETDAIGRFI
jgi:hypothetical protein